MYTMLPEDHYKDSMQQIKERVQDAENRSLVRAMRREERANRPSLFARSQHLMHELRRKLPGLAGQEQSESYPVQVKAQ